jgi:hypothetical protein
MYINIAIPPTTTPVATKAPAAKMSSIMLMKFE